MGGQLLPGLALVLVATGGSSPRWAVAVVLLGAGTALVYPTLLAAIGDVAHPAWRARAVGVYRLWRDGGFVVDARYAGLIADGFGLSAAIWAVAALPVVSGVVVACPHAVGGVGVVAAGVLANVWLLFGSLLVYGAGTATNLQARYAAADLALPSRRAVR